MRQVFLKELVKGKYLLSVASSPGGAHLHTLNPPPTRRGLVALDSIPSTRPQLGEDWISVVYGFGTGHRSLPLPQLGGSVGSFPSFEPVFSVACVNHLSWRGRSLKDPVAGR